LIRGGVDTHQHENLVMKSVVNTVVTARTICSWNAVTVTESPTNRWKVSTSAKNRWRRRTRSSRRKVRPGKLLIFNSSKMKGKNERKSSSIAGFKG
jgi:hypothetical protein